MAPKKTDWERARNAAKRITESSYTLKMFYEDTPVASAGIRPLHGLSACIRTLAFVLARCWLGEAFKGEQPLEN
eukprot:3457762-Amphidinium_carterae.1